VSEPRYGTVFLMDGQWLRFIDGVAYQAFTGVIELHKDAEVLGFETNGRVQANWFLTIRGERTSLNIFGCQVRAVLEHSRDEKVLGEALVLP